MPSGPHVAVIGGTGPLGRGLATRFARAGLRVVLGSRDKERASEVARDLPLGGSAPAVTGAGNLRACADADLLVVAVPADAQPRILPELAEAATGKVVISCANPLRFDGTGPMPLPVPAGSCAQECQQLLPGARVVAALHHVAARRLLSARPLPTDVCLCADDVQAKQVAADLIERIPGARAVDVGPLRLAGALEAFTAVLLSINAAYRVQAGIRIEGLAG